MKEISRILQTHDVDFARGFLPAQDPLLNLPDRYAEWDFLGANLTAYINAGAVRDKLGNMEVIPDPEFNSQAQLERAMLLLSFFAHAYVHAHPGPSTFLPACIAVPWVKVANTLQRKPILSHSSLVLRNWRRLDTAKPIQLDNLATLNQFHGGLDESWFYLVTVEVEQVGAKAIPLVLETMKWVADGDYERAAQCLAKVNGVLRDLIVVLRKMYANCDPHTFYLRVRPFVGSFENIEYRGCGLPPQSFHGGSAAQSSLLQLFDAALGIEYEEDSTREYLQLMRRHMPFRHAAFLSFVEENSSLRDNAAQSQALARAYEEAVQHLIAFRNEHLKMVALYIMKPAKQARAIAKGTGGTNPLVFLKSVRNQNETLLHDSGSPGMKESFKLTTHFPVPPPVVFNAWLNSAEHSKMTGGAARCTNEAGGTFTAWDGYITGKNLTLIEHTEITQSWRTTQFADSDEDSLLTIKLEETDSGTALTLVHTNIPAGQTQYEQGWINHYFLPMQEYFN